MKLALLSDGHLTSKTPRARINNTLLAGIRKLTFVFEYCKKNNIQYILQAGDLFNGSIDILALFKFISLITKYDIKFLSIWGQHDLSNRNKNVPTNLGILSKSGIINILSNDPYIINTMNRNVYDIKIYGCSWKDKVRNVGGNGNILVIHAPITTKPLWKGHKYDNAKKFIKEYESYDLILCGDIHRQFIYYNTDGRIICNTGPLLRLEATEYNFEHKPIFYVYDTKSKKTKTINMPHENAEKVLDAGHLEVANEESSLRDSYIDLKQIQNENIKIMSIIEELIRKSSRQDNIRKIIQELGDDIK